MVYSFVQLRRFYSVVPFVLKVQLSAFNIVNLSFVREDDFFSHAVLRSVTLLLCSGM